MWALEPSPEMIRMDQANQKMKQRHYLEAELEKLFQTDRALWHFIQDSSLAGVLYFDLEVPDQEWMSAEFWRAVGIDASARPLGNDWRTIIFGEDLHRVTTSMEASIVDPAKAYDETARYHHMDGSTVWLRCKGKILNDASGQPSRMFAVYTDVTAEKKAEQNAAENARALEASHQELRTFSYSMSHDMKAPANTMGLLIAELVESNRDKLDDDALELLSMCTVTIDRMKNLVEYVLEYTRIIGMEPQTSKVQIADAASHAINALQADIAMRNADIQIDPLPAVTAVPQQMNILMQNLISNAIKYTPPDRTPMVRVHSDCIEARDVIRINVTDNGMGIRADNQERIFKLFQRLHGHNDIPGSGIGLPMCRRIAQNHAGTLELVSSLETGSTFSFCLPTQALI